MPKADKHIIVGKIGSTYGIKGWLRIQTYTEFGASILNYSPWYLQKASSDTSDKTIAVEDSRMHGDELIVKFVGIETPEQARLLTNQFIAIQKSQLPSLNNEEYYWSDLEGLNVYNEKGVFLGKVIYLIATGSNDVLVIKGDKEYAIPYLPGQVVKKVDLDKGEIHVEWELI